MTDNEIAKGFNACFFKQSCKGCPYRKIWDSSATCLNTMLQDTFSLINRQKAEIERLENGIEELNCKLDMANDCISEQRTEAIKECIEKVKEGIVPTLPFNFGSTGRALDNLVKEMVGVEE